MREVYRILDANFNRAREALRVMEDFARFALNDATISAAAKELRSRMQEIYQHFPANELLAARDTVGDVGTAIASPTEYARADAAAVATAAGKRLTEALRTLEEYAKVAAPDEAARLEALRYQAYTLEQRIAQRLAVGKRFESVRLYVLLTSKLCKGEPLTVAEAAIAGGADCIQLREKDMPDGQLLELAKKVCQLARRRGALFIVNDRPDIAAIIGADGVHLGQDDLPISAARRVLPAGTLVGRSTHNIAQARAAADDGADYIGVGPMFATTTKDAGPLAGPEYLKQVVAQIATAHVAVGGISSANVAQVVAAGARRVAVCSAIIAAQDPAAAAKAIRTQIED
jgi:thiamine-phosphate pyrophosphorylase